MSTSTPDGIEMKPIGDAYVSSDSDSDSETELETLVKDGEAKDKSRMLTTAESDRMGISIYAEVLDAMYQARYLGTLFAFIGIYIGYQITIAPFTISSLDRSFNRINDLGLIRPVLNNHQQSILHHNLLHGETNFQLPEPYYDHIKVRFHQSVGQEGSYEPPQLFYDGVMFGLTDSNSHNLRYTGHKDYYKDNSKRNLLEIKQDLKSSLKSMQPKPTLIFPRLVNHNKTGWEEIGYAIYFSYDDLKKQGKLSSDKLTPWKRIIEDVITIARDFKQVYVTAWYPHEYGHPGDDDKEIKLHKENPNRYKTILQQVIPTRTGLHGITSKVPVLLSSVNYQKPTSVNTKRKLNIELTKGIHKPWSKDDHWNMYKPGGIKHKKYTSDQLKEMGYVMHPGVEGLIAENDEPPKNEDIDYSINIGGGFY
jgi:hypothetical protein